MTDEIKQDAEEVQTEETQTETKTEPKNDIPITYEMLEKLMDKKLSEMSDKVSELQKKYDDDTKKLKDEISAKEKEVAEQKKITANLLLNSSGKSNEEIDFNSVDFDDVDWAEQSKKYLSEMDKKIFGSE